ncbi:hypothetical protein NKG05_16270 [Oerskovia sp. M15]
MVNWTDHGEIDVAGPNGVAPFTSNSWAPGMAKKVVNGQEKYFLYYANGGGSSNVITGSSPLGPWTSERTSPSSTGRRRGRRCGLEVRSGALRLEGRHAVPVLRRWTGRDEHARCRAVQQPEEHPCHRAR